MWMWATHTDSTMNERDTGATLWTRVLPETLHAAMEYTITCFITRGVPGGPRRITSLARPVSTGKTTAISQMVSRAVGEYGRERVAICSLTKTAAREAAGRVDLPPGHVGTLHSFAYQALGGTIVIAESHAKDWTEAYPQWPMDAPHGALDEAPVERQSKQYLGDELLTAYSLLRARCEPLSYSTPLVRAFAEAWARWKKAQCFVDFTDLLVHALRDTVMAPCAPAVLYCDEAQDFSKLALSLLFHWSRHLDALYLVGDPLQCLFEWAGSDYHTVFPSNMPSERTTVLSQSYRIPETVHALAMRWICRHRNYREFAYVPRAAKGRAISSPLTLFAPDIWVEDLAIATKQQISTMIIASCSYMLVPLCTALRRAGVPFHNPWRSAQRAWNPLQISRGVSMPERIVSLLRRETEGYWSPRDIRAWLEPLRAEGVCKTGKKTVALLMPEDMLLGDVHSWLIEVLLPDIYTQVSTMDGAHLLAWWHDHLLSKYQESAAYPLRVYAKYGVAGLLESPSVVVGTYHSLKGAEAEVVYCAPDLSPAGFREWQEGGDGADAILRQWYVGLTRAKEELVILSPSTRRSLVT